VVFALLVMALMSPPVRKIQRMQVRLIPRQVQPEPAQPEPPQEEPAPITPAPTATPKPTPKPTPEPRATPRPTPEPKATATPKPTPTPAPKIKKVETEKKEVVKKVKEIVEEEPTPTPKPTPEPTATPVPTTPPLPALPATPPPIDTSKLKPEPPKVASKVTEVQASSVADFSQTYYQIIQQKVESNFRHPLSRSGITCRVRFTILRDGTITNIRVVQSTGNATIDQYALDAIRRTGKLPPLWDGFRKNALEDVTIMFHYERKS
jgi:TonB family protein